MTDLSVVRWSKQLRAFADVVAAGGAATETVRCEGPQLIAELHAFADLLQDVPVAEALGELAEAPERLMLSVMMCRYPEQFGPPTDLDAVMDNLDRVDVLRYRFYQVLEFETSDVGKGRPQ
jgi:hypothetical protein